MNENIARCGENSLKGSGCENLVQLAATDQRMIAT